MMQHQTARELTELLHKHAKEQNNILNKISGLEPDEELKKIKLMIGHTMAAIYTDALYWIYKEHPDLKPPEIHQD